MPWRNAILAALWKLWLGRNAHIFSGVQHELLWDNLILLASLWAMVGEVLKDYSIRGYRGIGLMCKFVYVFFMRTPCRHAVLFQLIQQFLI